MCFDERDTERRKRSLLRLAMRARTRRWRRLNRSFDLLVIALPLFLLAFLAADVLVAVLDALALIGLGLAEGADHRRRLPDPLPVGAGNGDRGRLLAGDLDVARDREDDVVAVAQLQHQVLALDRGAIAHPLDLQALGEALGHAGDHVVDESARRAPMDAGALGLVLRLHYHLAVLHCGADLAAQRQLERAELALGGDGLPGDLDGDALRDGYGIFADARHLVTSRTRGRGLRRRHWRHGPRCPTSRRAASTGWRCPARYRRAAGRRSWSRCAGPASTPA